MKKHVTQQEAPAEKANQAPISQELQDAIETLIERLRNNDPISESR